MDRKLAEQLLDGAGAGSVLVVGDAMLDRYLSGSVERISPEAPVPVLRVEEERSALGGAANVAAGIVALGARCRLVATVGDDPAGAALMEELAGAGIDPGDLVVDGDRPTTEKTRILARHQQMLRVDRETVAPLRGEAASRLRTRALEALEEADVLVLEDYDKGVLSPALSRDLLDAAAGGRMEKVHVEAVARIFGSLAAAGLCHGDTKATNFLVAGDAVALVDLDAMAERPAALREDVRRFLANWDGDPALQLRFRERFAAAALPLPA